MPFEATILLTQMERGIMVERMSLASRRNARVLSDTAPLNHIQGSSAVEQEDDVRILTDAAVEDLREDEPVDRAHDERVEDRPQVAERARRVPDAQVAPGQQPERAAIASERRPLRRAHFS